MSAATAATHIRLMGAWHIVPQGAPRNMPLGLPRRLLTHLLRQPAHRARRDLTGAVYRLRTYTDTLDQCSPTEMKPARNASHPSPRRNQSDRV